MATSSKTSGNLGFTLVEILIAVVILGVLVGMVVFLLDPLKQLGKVNDARRESDFKHLSSALDTYYNDKASYPTQLDDVLNDPENGNYMQVIPQDPVDVDSKQYLYLTDGSSNAQWYVLFAQLDSKPEGKPLCPLENLSENCVPADYAGSGYNYCVYGGDVDCSVVSTTNLTELKK